FHETAVAEAASGRPLLQVPAGFRRRQKESSVSTAYDSQARAISPDGRWLAVAKWAGIELWDVIEQKNVPFHPPHPTPDSPGNVRSHCEDLAFLSNDRLIAQYGDMSALVWELPAEALRPRAIRMTAKTWDELGGTEPLVGLRAVWALKNSPRAGV